MSNNEHPEARDAHRAIRCTFGPVREKDLVWPPPDEDMDACSVVHLDGSDPLAPLPPVEARPVAASRSRLKPTFGDCRDPGIAPRVRPLIFPMEPPPLPAAAADDELPDELPPHHPHHEPASRGDTPAVPFPLATDADLADPEVTGASRSAWLAVFFAAACALVTVVQYRAIFTLPAEVATSAAEQPPVPEGVSAEDLAPAVPAASAAAPRQPVAPPRTSAPPAPVAVPAKLEQRPNVRTQMAAAPVRPTPVRTPKVAPSATPPPDRERRLVAASERVVQAPVPAASSRVAINVVNRGAVPVAPDPRPVAPAAPASKPAAIAPTDASSAAAVAPPPATLTAAVVAAPEPTANATSATTTPRPVAAVLTDAGNGDEADIRSTLTRFRTAYSQLNARAARDVWPSVDARALERAFQSLKSQELRFDRCNLTVTGARAQAACTGRAIYVPRIGDQSPRYTAREWTFELRKADERWTIASARTL